MVGGRSDGAVGRLRRGDEVAEGVRAGGVGGVSIRQHCIDERTPKWKDEEREGGA